MIGETKTPVVSREQFLRNLKDCGLLTSDDMQQLLVSLAETDETNSKKLAQQLVAAGKLT